MAFPILAFTSSLVMWSLYEIPRSLRKHLISNACILLSVSAAMVHVSHAYKYGHGYLLYGLKKKKKKSLSKISSHCFVICVRALPSPYHYLIPCPTLQLVHPHLPCIPHFPFPPHSLAFHLTPLTLCSLILVSQSLSPFSVPLQPSLPSPSHPPYHHHPSPVHLYHPTCSFSSPLITPSPPSFRLSPAHFPSYPVTGIVPIPPRSPRPSCNLYALTIPPLLPYHPCPTSFIPPPYALTNPPHAPVTTTPLPSPSYPTHPYPLTTSLFLC